ncbi:hypothetical protein DLAC_01645 [Tieghemostelium lacteum]|uniref:Ribonuclease H2 subunit B n=1 Tax=Tieghemostelium lacteum TaxID=361077 RepID=A0A152A5Y7_TIELA|nr:hypothetical protein DLAC_01645 [Tieghemostelium lacteum]|eukprot:KYR01642.1 hypothetical protein DLAC_01645 [Tieghemostelium lacteum]
MSDVEYEFSDIEEDEELDEFDDEEEEQTKKKSSKKSTAKATTNKRKIKTEEPPPPVASLPYIDRVFVIYLPNKWLEVSDTTSNNNNNNNNKETTVDYKIISLPHPKTLELTRFIHHPSTNTLLEINKFLSKPSSWFINNSVRHDGSLYLASPIDPLFLILPFLEKLRGNVEKDGGMFGELSSAKNDESFSQLTRLSFNNDQLSLICQVKDICGHPMYRLDDTKLMLWLRCKVSKLSLHLKETNTNIYTSSSNQVSANVPKEVSKEALMTMSIGFLGEYLSTNHIKLLETFFGVDDKKKLELQQKQFEANNRQITTSASSSPTTTTSTSKTKKIKTIESHGSSKITSFFNVVKK